MKELSNEDRLFFSKMKPPKIQKILFVCKGNTCRSIIAEAILKTVKEDYIVYSVGTESKEEKISENTKKVLLENNIKINKFFGTNINNLKENKFYRIIILDEGITLDEKIKSNFKHIRHIEDPYKKDIEIYRKTFKEIKEILEEIPGLS